MYDSARLFLPHTIFIIRNIVLELRYDSWPDDDEIEEYEDIV